MRPKHHHIGIHTNDLDNAVGWYRDFFGGDVMWSLETFSELTRSRLPGIDRLTEVAAGDVRFHLFERDGEGGAPPTGEAVQYQHVCMVTDSAEELRSWRRRWLDIFDSRRYAFARSDPPTDIVTDADGSQSFYMYDVHGLEFEFTYIPEAVR